MWVYIKELDCAKRNFAGLALKRKILFLLEMIDSRIVSNYALNNLFFSDIKTLAYSFLCFYISRVNGIAQQVHSVYFNMLLSLSH